jgi:hypothetical protein
VVPTSSQATSDVNGTPVQLASSAVEQTSPRQVSAGRTTSGGGASLLLDPLSVDVGDVVLLSFAAGLDVASDDPPLQAAREALVRTPASTQATRRRRVMT